MVVEEDFIIVKLRFYGESSLEVGNKLDRLIYLIDGVLGNSIG